MTDKIREMLENSPDYEKLTKITGELLRYTTLLIIEKELLKEDLTKEKAKHETVKI